jgi:hypothetical protein
MSFEATVELQDDLDAVLPRIRSERRLRTPAFKRLRCGHVGEGAEPHVRVRAMVLSLNRFGIARRTDSWLLREGGQRIGSKISLIFIATFRPVDYPPSSDDRCTPESRSEVARFEYLRDVTLDSDAG